jgi:hypothetical protein
MNQSIKRISLFAAAIVAGAAAFGLFWSAQVQAVTTANGPWCPPNTQANHTTNVTMCYKGTTTTPNVDPTTQTVYLTGKNGSYCGACGSSGN